MDGKIGIRWVIAHYTGRHYRNNKGRVPIFRSQEAALEYYYDRGLNYCDSRAQPPNDLPEYEVRAIKLNNDIKIPKEKPKKIQGRIMDEWGKETINKICIWFGLLFAGIILIWAILIGIGAYEKGGVTTQIDISERPK